MGVTTFSSREFNQDAGRAKRAAAEGPVFITDRGRAAHVLLSIEDYQRLLGSAATLLDTLAQTDGGDFAFEPARLDRPVARAADLS